MSKGKLDKEGCGKRWRKLQVLKDKEDISFESRLYIVSNYMCYQKNKNSTHLVSSLVWRTNLRSINVSTRKFYPLMLQNVYAFKKVATPSLSLMGHIVLKVISKELDCLPFTLENFNSYHEQGASDFI